MIVTNADLKVSPQEAAKRLQVEREAAAIDEAVKAAEKRGELHPGKSVEVGARQVATTDKRLSDTDAFRTETRAHLQPQYFRVGPRVVAKGYTKAEYDAVRKNLYCPRCDELQKDPPPQWVTEDGVDTPQFFCSPPKGRGCSWPLGAIGLVYLANQLGMEVRVFTDNEKGI